MGGEAAAEAPELERKTLSSSEITAVAHLYRGEVYRSTIWRTRLDTTTNWAVVTLGVALSISFSAPGASPLPLVLVGVLILLFLMLEARRYRYFNVWRARCRWMEQHFYAPMLDDGDLHLEENWQKTLAADYLRPTYHVTLMTAVGRRIRSNYLWILLIQSLAFAGKLAVHPTPVKTWDEAVSRADVGPVAGEVLIVAGVLYVAAAAGMALWSWQSDVKRGRQRGRVKSHSMG
ncbi:MULTISPECIES: DUF2270 domain-containing protein [Mameliella]|uniref:Integral membrane protein n=1 Tax=Mameliella alba TaxID=561184 RepID=A0A0B3S3Z9_9RHOB|nr:MULTISPECIES: DUF2270 domain-containing protein [Mameliella]MBV6638797.1 DUF2270 domain-containing protein [Mameliella sp.]MCR9272659.1 DUF2270 domain-containing protein [Paracoccaceae bacterium]ODM47808.1 hypothetical protein A9320_21815 [Ruegeria sp. PBVC088]KHQ53753.1 hypothetical protein OA50_01742 [Mameliella alba]MDD9733424.1 DUF2270 domain-containing protein [Mameliella sp. AT18]